MNTIVLKAYPAKGGDCFLITYKGKYILIDSGYKKTSDRLINDLRNISNKGGKIDLLLITHIDNDHIGGAIKLLEDNVIEINKVWYNGYAQIFNIEEAIENEDRDSMMKVKNIISNNIVDEHEENYEVGYKEAESFEELLYKNNVKINQSFNEKLILSQMPIKLNEEIEFTFLSPTVNEIEDLKFEWNDVLCDNNYYNKKRNIDGMQKAFEFYHRKNNLILESTPNECSVENEDYDIDKLVKNENIGKLTNINNSSLAFIVTINDKNFLFLGDSNPKVVFNELKILIENDKKYQDIVMMKVSHHGSKNNTTNDLLSLINVESFLISTDGSPKKDGKASKPDVETIAKILYKQKKMKLYFNYPKENYNESILNLINTYNCKDKYDIKVEHGNGIQSLRIEF